MEAKELLEKYPKVELLLREWWNEKVKNAIDTADLSDEYKETIKNIKVDNVQIERTIEGNPHTLFEFFDENKIHIGISTYIISGSIAFRTKIGDIDSNKDFRTRKGAERDVINEAFEILEEKL